ncbi:MAG TPA: copper amine oxidase N-terminal domain-containing protein [Candidatus Baltobacteraceae bacterium]|nr:copper amine oxidase N-terminal domain-containing protein [Candidatus Baltobacteraceae bacterium]
MTYRRPTVQTLVLTAVFAALGSTLLAFSRPADMVVDGQTVESDVPPVTTGNRVYVPVRSLADALGAQTSVDGTNIYVVRGSQSLRLRVGDVHATINGMPFTLKHAPFRVRGRVMIGLRAMARVLGVQASYDPRTARIQVMTPGIGEAAPGPPAQTQ